MKSLREERGFTILELLVAINVSCILITLVVSVFLFVTKFSKNIIIQSEKNSEVHQYLNYLADRIQKGKNYTVNAERGRIYIVFDERDTLEVYSKERNQFVFTECTGIKLKIKSVSGEVEEINSDIMTEFKNKYFLSQEIKSILFIFNVKGRDYLVECYNPVISTQRIKNII